MYENPLDLQELCLDFIADHHDEVFESFCVPELVETTKMCFKFKDPDIYLFNELSDKLLCKLNEKNKLNDETLHIFNGKNTRLQKIKIKDTEISFSGLQILKEHKINELICVDMKNISISKILDCLNDYSIANLTHLNVSKCTFIDISRHTFMVRLINLENLRSLNVSCTEFNQQTLQIICEDLKHLERLDISSTCVYCLKPLLLIKDQLITLIASDLRNINKMTATIIDLESLRHLDISAIHENDILESTSTLENLLKATNKLTHLIYLDVSGWKVTISESTLRAFLQTHQKLKYLGVVMNQVENANFVDYKRDLIIGALNNESQIVVSLSKYFERHWYVQKALYHLFQLTATLLDPRCDLIELVLGAMCAHPMKFGVQMAATACIYNLTRGKVAKDLHVRLLQRGVHLTLNAMENYPTEYQLQKNALLTLCSHRILQDVDFDRFRCAKLVLDCLCAFDEINMNRMSVAICSILATKVTTVETSQLGAKPLYMRKLLAMVKDRVTNSVSDITMKFTLSALWNLTDESASTCQVFLANGGSNLFINVLQTFRGDATVETKVLGLLNNIAEVESLRPQLRCGNLMHELLLLLKNEHIDVSYFAAGTVAHLASDGVALWVDDGVNISREVMLVELEAAVKAWIVPDTEMVAYRSFKPFFPLLRVEMDYGVQLWAMWAVHHVCNKNPERYCLMLREENGVPLLQNLIESNCNEHIKKLSLAILEFSKILKH